MNIVAAQSIDSASSIPLIGLLHPEISLQVDLTLQPVARVSPVHILCLDVKVFETCYQYILNFVGARTHTLGRAVIHALRGYHTLSHYFRAG